MNQREIARQAGCSPATVNRALAGHPRVALALRARVLAVAATLGYAPPHPPVPVPDLRRRTVALLLREPPRRNQDPIVDDLIAGLGEEAAAQRLTLAPASCPGPAPELLASRPCDLPGLRDGVHLGAILWGWEDPELVRWLAGSVPCVVVGNLLHLREPWATVTINHYAGTVLMLDHLLDLGHRRIGFIHAEAVGSRSHERLGAFIQALALRGLDVAQPEVLHLPRPADCRSRLPPRIAAGTRAWICDSHATGLAAQAALAEAGIRVPEQVSLVSFLAKAHPADRPPLTGVRGPFRALGRIALRALLEPKAEWEPGRRILLDVDLEPGGTCGSLTAG